MKGMYETLFLAVTVGIMHQVATGIQVADITRKLRKSFKAYELTNVSVTGPVTEDLYISFLAFGKSFNLVLHQAILKTTNVTVMSKFGPRSYEMLPLYYSGKLENNVSSFAHGTLENGVFSGSVYTNGKASGEIIYIEPLCKFATEEKCSNMNSVVYKRSDVVINGDLKKAMRYKTAPYVGKPEGIKQR